MSAFRRSDGMANWFADGWKAVSPAARLDQAEADKRGYTAAVDYDNAAAEEWVCRSFRAAVDKNDQAAFADILKQFSTRTTTRPRASTTIDVSSDMSAPISEKSLR